jgi:hypothetical protein
MQCLFATSMLEASAPIVRNHEGSWPVNDFVANRNACRATKIVVRF